jgi:hypothetical protein
MNLNFAGAIKINPEIGMIWFHKGEALEAIGHASEAQAAFVEADELGCKADPGS